MNIFNRRHMLGLMGGTATVAAMSGLAPRLSVAAAAPSGAAVSHAGTLKSLMAAVAGEMEANAKYRAFADAAEKEGRKEIAAIFRAIAEAEKKHAEDEFRIAQSLGQVTMPKVGAIKVGTIKENLQSAIDGETYEYTGMYPEFINIAEEEHMTDARLIFILAKLGEEVHAGIYADLLKNVDKFDKEKYAKIYRCPECGNIVLQKRPKYCSLCAEPGAKLISYTIVA